MRIFENTNNEKGTITIVMHNDTRQYEASFNRCKLEDIRNVLRHLLERIESGDFIADEGIQVSHE